VNFESWLTSSASFRMIDAVTCIFEQQYLVQEPRRVLNNRLIDANFRDFSRTAAKQ
jgi:hypothetical protein